jgi:hypothetical protein
MHHTSKNKTQKKKNQISSILIIPAKGSTIPEQTELKKNKSREHQFLSYEKGHSCQKEKETKTTCLNNLIHKPKLTNIILTGKT